MKLWFERGAWVSQRGRNAIENLHPLDVKRIAVIRHAALGDMVLLRPFLVEARRFFPNAEIVLSLVSNYTYGAPTDLVDSVHVVPGSNEKNINFRNRIAKIKELGSVDILFDLANTTRSRYVCFLNPAQIKIGFPYKGFLRNLLLDAAVLRSDFTFEGETLLHALMLLGANPKVPLNYAWPHEITVSETPEFDNSIVYFPFASVNSKCWPQEYFYSLVEKSAQQHPSFKHVILSGVGSHENTKSYQPLVENYSNVYSLPTMNLEAMTKLLARAALVVSNDTGIRNLAISLDTPTLGIFFSTVPFRYWPRIECHQAIFVADGSLPTVQEVLSSLSSSMDQ